MYSLNHVSCCGSHGSSVKYWNGSSEVFYSGERGEVGENWTPMNWTPPLLYIIFPLQFYIVVFVFSKFEGSKFDLWCIWYPIYANARANFFVICISCSNFHRVHLSVIKTHLWRQIITTYFFFRSQIITTLLEQYDSPNHLMLGYLESLAKFNKGSLLYYQYVNIVGEYG